MKKHEKFKILGIVFLVGILLTWLIPAGQFTENGFELYKIMPLGFIDIFRTLLSTFANFIHYGMLFLIIGGLYGVMNKTGVYSLIIDNIIKKVKGKEQNFLIFTILFFIIFSSLIGINYLIFILVPFFITILLLLNYEKTTAFVVTIGSILVGNLGATYSNDVNNWLNYFFGKTDLVNKIDEFNIHNQMITRIIFLIIITVLFILFIIKKTKDETENGTESNKKGKKEKLNIPLYTKNIKKGRNPLPLIIICSFAFGIMAIGMFNWNIAFGIEYFENIHASIMGANANGFPIIANLIGSIGELGSWGIYELTIISTIFIIVLAWIYSLSVEETVDSFISGVKEMVPIAFYAIMVNVLFSLIYFNSTGANFFYTIANFLVGLTTSLNLAILSIISIIGSLIYNNFADFANVLNMITYETYNNTLLLPVITLVLQFIHGLVMFVAPTSILLITGLSYLDISYKEWISYIWKYLLKVVVITFVVLIIVMMFV